MSETSPYDVCVVGAGLIGASVAKYVSGNHNLKVCLVGPGEPQAGDYSRDIYGAHYDEARITREADKIHMWSVLAQRSIDRYRDIEKKSGIKFYSEIGNLIAGTRDCYWTSSPLENARVDRLSYMHLDSRELKKLFPYLKFADDDVALYQPKRAGLINPRKLLDAQIAIARKNGCDVFREIVSSVEKKRSASGGILMNVRTEDGHSWFSRRVLLATGPYLQYRKLLDPAYDIDHSQVPFSVALAEISERDAAKLSDMTGVTYRGFGAPNYYSGMHRGSDGAVSYTLLPPVKYPNGKWYLKMTGPDASRLGKPRNLTPTEMKAWYRDGGDRDLSYKLYNLLKTIIPDVKLLSWKRDGCMMVSTPTTLPYIDMVNPNLGIITGCNGYSAKSCDELGLMGANLITTGHWEHDLPADMFKLKLKSVSAKL